MITLCGQITSFYSQVNFDADLKINLLISLIDAREAEKIQLQRWREMNGSRKTERQPIGYSRRTSALPWPTQLKTLCCQDPLTRHTHTSLPDLPWQLRLAKFNYHLSPVTGGITLTGIHIFLVLDTQEKSSLVKAGSVNHNMAMYSTGWNNSQHSGKWSNTTMTSEYSEYHFSTHLPRPK